MRADIRLAANDAATSLAAGGKEVDAQGKTSLVVADDENDGKAASIVLLAADGTVVFRIPTTVGGGS